MPAAGPHPESLEAIADRLLRTRQALGLSQAQFCRMTGIEPQAWNNYERGRNRISIDQALKICQAIGITTDWIYRGTMSASLPTALQVALQSDTRPKKPRR